MKADCDAVVQQLNAARSDDPVAAFPLGRLQAAGMI